MKKFAPIVALVLLTIVSAWGQFVSSQANSKVPQVVQGKVVAHGKVVINGGDTGTAQLVGITLSPATAWVSPAGTKQYSALGTFSDGSTGDVTGLCSWASSPSATATINSLGLATGVAVNSSPANITCTDPTSGVVSGPALLYVSSVTITTSTCPNGTQNAVYSGCNLAATGGSGVYTWSVDLLPPGLTLNTSTGVIGGTPTVLGTTNFNASVVDSNGIQDSQALSIAVGAAAGLALQAVAFPQANSGAAYGPFVQTATGGSGNYTTPPAACAVTSGALPASITVSSSSTGCLYQTSGTVTAALGTYTGTTQITDSAGNTASQSFSITVANGPPTSYSSPWCHQATTGALSCPATGTCDCNPWPVASVPAFGGLLGKATCVNDARTGNKVMRITDSSLTTQILHNSDAGTAFTINSNDTMAFVASIGGTYWVVQVNFNACTVGTPIKLPQALQGEFYWDVDLPNVFYAQPLTSTIDQKCVVNTTTSTVSCTPFFDLADNPGTTPHGSGGLLPGYKAKYLASSDGYSLYDNGTTYNPHHIFTYVYAGGPPWAQNGPYGTTWQVNWVVQPTNNNTLKNSFRVTSCAGACTGATTEPNWDSACATTCTDGNITWTNIGVHTSQDTPDDLVRYDSTANCFTWVDLLIGYVMRTNCAGQATGPLNYINGQTFAAAGKAGAHGGGQTYDSRYVQFEYSGSWKYVWTPGTLNVDYCLMPGHFCDAHSAQGVVGYYAGFSGIRLHPWGNINSSPSYPILFNPHSGHKFSYNNAVVGDSTPILSNTTQAGHLFLNYTVPFFSEVDAFPTDGSNNIWRFFQTYNSMISWSYHIQDSSTQVSRSGKILMFTTDMEGTLGSDKGHNTCTAGQPGCSVNSTTGDTCIIGGDGWKLSTAYTAGTITNPGVVISTSGYPQAKGNSGHYAFKALNNGTSTASNTLNWCQTPPSAWGAGDGCTTVDNNITWQNIGQLDCRGDVFWGALN